MRWSQADDDTLRSMHGIASFEEIAASVGRKVPAVKWRVTQLGLAKRKMWSAEEVALLIAIYERAGESGVLDLKSFAERIGRDTGNVARKAISLGLKTNRFRAKVEDPKGRPRKFDTDEDRAADKSRRMKAWLSKYGHQKGMLGKTHSEETKKVLAQRSRDRWLFMPDHKKDEMINKSIRSRRAANAGSVPPKIARGSWKAGWREVGGQKAYFRSRWEANYARYLEWLRSQGQIISWRHEPKTFWFENIKRGVRSYLPDFEVVEVSGAIKFHEVKGWMDARSRTTIKRFRKYYPDEDLIVVDERAYRSIERKAAILISGWEK